jgi:4-hydroxy-4-methyl-2-oxoglutarate aldolase
MVKSITDRLEACYTGVVHDVMRAAGFKDFTLPPTLRPILPERSMAGPAFTILGKVDPNADPHETLLAWTGLLSKAPADCVWVDQPNDALVAHMGELSAETLRNKGVRGCVTHGLIRDVNALLAMGFQTWACGFTPRDIVGIEPGDYLLGDRDGLIRIPAGIAEDVVTMAERAMTTESKVRTAILAGVDPQEAYIKFGKF